jgi:hypothetical protein
VQAGIDHGVFVADPVGIFLAVDGWGLRPRSRSRRRCSSLVIEQASRRHPRSTCIRWSGRARNQSHFNSTSRPTELAAYAGVYRRRNPAGISEAARQSKNAARPSKAPKQESHWEATIVEQLGAPA